MKRGQLNAAIDAAPKVYGNTRLGLIAFEKGSLKAAVMRSFPDGAGQRTGYKLDQWDTPDGKVWVVRGDPDD